MLTDGQLKPSSNTHQSAQIQTLQPGLPASTGVNSSSGTLSRSRFHWSHALIAVGLLAASGAGTALIVKVLPPAAVHDVILIAILMSEGIFLCYFQFVIYV